MSSTTVTKNLLACEWQHVAASAMEDLLHTTIVQALARYQSALRLGDNVCLAIVSAEGCHDHLLYPEEEQALSPNACAQKRTEVALGRTAVRRALRKLGEPPFPVLRGEHGEPVWPGGVTGSITHCWPWTAALLARTGKRFAIGIDLENLEQAAMVDISNVICTLAELDWVRSVDFLERLAMIFSAKEAVYKGFHPFCRRYIDFKEVELSWLPEPRSFRVAFVGGLETEFAALGECQVLSRRINSFVFSCLVHGLQDSA